MKKRLISMLLVFALVLSMVPVVHAANSIPFTDVSTGDWYYDYVVYAYENSLMQGTASNKFSPDESMTRGMFVTVLGRMVGVNTANYTFNYFTDVNTTEYYAGYINWAAANGIVKGYPGGTFRPDVAIARQDMATIFSRYLSMAGYDFPEDPTSPASFRDASQIADYAVDHVDRIRSIGLMKGNEDGTLRPNSTATRAECATVFMRFRELIIAANAPQTYTVSFMYNYGNKGTFATRSVSGGESVEYLASPLRSGYSFTGWYLDQECTQLYDFTGIVTQNFSLYAGWQSNAESGNDQISGSYNGGDTVYSITALEVNGTVAKVTVNAPERCVLALTFTNEDTGATITTSGARVSAGSEMTVVPVSLNTTLPTYFKVTAQLLDGSFNVLASYECDLYTSTYAEFAAQTIYDFGDSIVLNFDEAEDNNFGVLSDNVKQIVTDGSNNVVTFTDGVYTITGSTDDVTALTEGDCLLLYVDGEPALVKVDTITVSDNGTVVITPSTDNYLADFYTVLKVDMTVTAQPEDMDMSEADDGIELVPVDQEGDTTQSIEDVNVDKSGSANLGFDCAPFSTNFYEFNFGVAGSVTASLVIVYDLVLFGDDYLKFEFVTDYNTDFHASIVAKYETNNSPDADEKEIKLGKVAIPFGVTGLDAFVDLKVCFNWSLKAGLSYTASSTVSTGFKYDTVNGRRDVDKKSFTHSLDCKGTVEITFGPKPSAGISFLDKALKAEVNCFIGGKGVAEAEVPLAQGGDEEHGCFLCVDGEIYGCVTPKFELSYEISEHLKGKPIDLTLFELKKHLADFYISLLNDVNSIFQGQPHMDEGDCPNLKYKTTIVAQDTLGNEVSVNVLVSGEDGMSRGSFTSGGNIYLYEGNYTASAMIDGISVSRSFTVSEAAQTVILSPQTLDGTLSGTVTDASNNNAISGATIAAYQNGVLVKSTSTNGSGSFTMDLAEGTYEIKISATDYITFSTTTTIYPSDTKYLETSLMVKEEENMGGLAGYITDAVTGRGISGVNLEIYRGWGNTDGDPVATLTTNSSGYYVYETWTIFGMIWGLPIGNYTIKATHADYNDTTFNVVVLGDMVLSNQNATMNPLNAEMEYRIVLTWGSTPRDLDSHFNGVTLSGSRDHVYFSRKNGTTTNLDVDDTSSYGPETITVTDFANLSNGFTYSVHDYTNRSSSSSTYLSSSGATVKLYLGDTLLRTYNVPTGRTGTVWNVFSVDANGNITSLNSFDNISAPGSVGAGFVGDALSSVSDPGSEKLKDYELE